METLNMIRKIITILMIIAVSGCTSIASVSNFETSASQIDFNKLEQSYDRSPDGAWSWEGKNEYIIFVKNTDSSELYSLLITFLKSSGYKIVNSSNDGTAIIGKKGIRFNDWGSVIGAYLSPSNDEYQVYVKVEVTQDITGGWTENRAKHFGIYFCDQTNLCRTPYN